MVDATSRFRELQARRKDPEGCHRISIPAHQRDRLEAAQDKALGVERRLPGGIETLVLVHLRLGRIEARLVGPDLPGEDDLLALLCRNRAAEVSLLAVGNEVFPTL